LSGQCRHNRTIGFYNNETRLILEQKGEEMKKAGAQYTPAFLSIAYY
jgi:hypothetical protein